MDISEEKEIYQLTRDMVSIITRKYADIGGERQQLGADFIQPYRNFAPEREELLANEPEEIANAVMAIWGGEPTIRVQAGGDGKEGGQ